MDAIELKAHALKRALIWTKEPFDVKTRQEVERLIEGNGEALLEQFYTDLEFGTGGLRGLMGPGTNRMNRYTIAQTTQGLAQYILMSGAVQPSVAIAYDSRNGSAYLDNVAEEVM